MSEQSEDDSQKTEEPTPKKLEDARKKGEVTYSQEINHWLMLVAITIVIAAVLPAVVRDIGVGLKTLYAGVDRVPMDPGGIGRLLRELALQMLLWLMLPVLVFMVAALASGLAQRGGTVSAESLKPSLSKISLIGGLKRQFSAKALVEFLKGLIKLLIVAGVSWLVARPRLDDLDLVAREAPITLIERIADDAFVIVMAAACVMSVVGAADYAFQRFEFMKKMKMSQREVRDEMKQSEGDPIIKSRLRQIRMERARKRMMAAVPTADVVITNPTHFAVALKYDPPKMPAPVVVAMGVDAVAFRIRDLALENGVAVVENPPLARALWDTAQIDREIPFEHYQAVAEVIGYVFRAKGRRVRG
ncbi:flagellar biosynthesis protein FlhB [Tistrella sp. BH-R2-4]|uniref:Flagellar biosynthetic protein FlhB n=1 Tax=Tistrella arctica TaxID=3133430 RepID=A0ABU9YI82_9PROT